MKNLENLTNHLNNMKVMLNQSAYTSQKTEVLSCYNIIYGYCSIKETKRILQFNSRILLLMFVLVIIQAKAVTLLKNRCCFIVFIKEHEASQFQGLLSSSPLQGETALSNREHCNILVSDIQSNHIWTNKGQRFLIKAVVTVWRNTQIVIKNQEQIQATLLKKCSCCTLLVREEILI